MIACSAQQVGKSYGGNTVFENMCFEIHERDRVGLTGRNGSGKTTLFKLLAGAEVPDTGKIHWRKGCEIGYLAQIPDYPAGMKAIDVLKTAFTYLLEMEKTMKKMEQQMANENVPDQLNKLIGEYGELQDQFALNNGYEMDSQIERISNGLDISSLLNKDFSILSGGEKTKVCLAHMLLKSPNLLLLDEPTNHLDIKAVEWLADFIKNYEGTVVLISHDRYFLDETAGRILDLEGGEITLYQTNYSGFVKEKEERLMREFQQYEEQQKKIKKMKEAIKRLREWANQCTPPNAGLHKRASSMEKALHRMEKLDRPVLNRKKMNMDLEASERSGKDVVLMKEVSKSFGSKHLFQNVSIHIQFRDRTAIVGDNGTGKSTLVKMILGELKPDAGEIRRGSNLKVGYLSQHVFADADDQSVIDAFKEGLAVTEGEARHILAGFLFYGYTVFRKVSQLSGGEKMRLRLAQLMHRDINFLILDEPTNHLDIESREVLEEALEEFNGTILAVSHDRYFINRIFSKIYWIDQKELHYYEGNYDRARKKMDEKWRAVMEVPPVKKAKIAAVSPKKKDKVQETEELENAIEQLETTLMKLETVLESEMDLEKLQTFYNEKEELEKKREELYRKLDAIL
ncbi:ribosomal protection-like ABC-F family protein [Cytobacillus oceanisediminis]|uniref:ribosomal protection-like ABC-F family protein n=1 Tax=Cytobacillus TaxID=2675230 RepID=UPI00203F9612|nr:ABC-F type ribosomal protection protein [Cytobacillus oceanisediminis]MCM3241866.1 ABC-F type ribosomal protection protein [Cytobacillus oceanisediminis]MCM3403842.1 ABC-F type ribosomal protection protein [Cytobacillus oceanisediminis]MDK7668740.1 ABC-F type ribosomal protection protein [Cytobacillus oceanisediminis]